MNSNETIKYLKIVKGVLEWVISLVPKEKLPSDLKEDYEKGQKKISALQTAISMLERLDDEEKMQQEMMKFTPDLVEKSFPKGQCKERGRAIVLHAEMLIKICKAIKPYLLKKNEER